MDYARNGSAALPHSVRQAIDRLITDANRSDLPIVDVTASAAKLAASMPEAAALGLERLSDAITSAALRDSRVGLTLNRAA